MKVVKVFNNNVVLVNIKNHQQAILFGNGIGFKNSLVTKLLKAMAYRLLSKISKIRMA
ncbi:CAT RNA binding domain-containing protein [Lactobacillus sp. R2/2]|nr:CAT RNA binding domain-containing protein [Lactobacillus sp. R2/2]